MKIVHTDSLGDTLDALNEAFFYGRALSSKEKIEAAKWIASRQGLPRSYRGMFAPTDEDFREGATMFTGENVKTRGGSAHMLGQEACRALLLLDVDLPDVRAALDRASAGIDEALDSYPRHAGTYCCGKCSVSFWRHLSAGGLKNREGELSGGLAWVKSLRDGTGKWRRLPFYYTLLALDGIELPGAIQEMRYAAPVLDRMVKRSPRGEFGQRRLDLAERILGKC
jgi:hypothetical protein